MLNFLMWVSIILWILVSIYAVLFKSTDDGDGNDFKYPPPEYFQDHCHCDKDTRTPAEKHHDRMMKK